MADSRRVSGCLPCTNCFVTVPQDKLYAVEKFGRYSHVIGAGLSVGGFDCCHCCVTYRSISNRIEQNVCQVRTKTRDNVFINVIVAVQQSVHQEQAEAAIYKLADVHGQIDSYVSDVVRSKVPKLDLDEVFEKKEEISDACQEQLAENMALFGFEIHRALVTELQPDADVAQSMNEINKQKRLRDAALIGAESEKIRVVKRAEAEADSQHLAGQGIARQRAAIVEGLKESIVHGSTEVLSSDKVSELLMITQYFEAVRDVGTKSRTQCAFIPSGPGALADIADQINKGVLQPAPSQTSMRA